MGLLTNGIVEDTKVLDGTDGSDIGGPAGTGHDSEIFLTGAGNPTNGTGGLLIIKAKTIKNMGTLIANGSSVSRQYDAVTATGGGSGGGSINVFYESCEIFDATKVSAQGGAKLGGTPAGGAGGNGSITIGSIATGDFVCNYKNY